MEELQVIEDRVNKALKRHKTLLDNLLFNSEQKNQAAPVESVVSDASPETRPCQVKIGRSARISRRWLDELAKRRTVWCWNVFDGPSNAMWHLYGSRGVAIRSTVGDVKKALANSGCVRRLIAPHAIWSPK